MGGDGDSKGRAGPAIGVIGAAAAIASIWWFAFRPRRGRDDEADTDGVELIEE